ncbi:hypothetical protein ACP4OV_028905 [Aristida adscensionis]
MPRRALLRRGGLPTGGAPLPQWAMIVHTQVTWSPGARRAILELRAPPSASQLLVPANLVDPSPRLALYSDGTCPIFAGIVHAVSGDGHLLLDFGDFRGPGPVGAAAARARGGSTGPEGGAETQPSIVRCVCNPLSGEVFRLPDVDVGGVPTFHSHGLLTGSARGHGPPDRYAVAEIGGVRGVGGPCYAFRRFLSQTGKWEALVGLPAALPRPRPRPLCIRQEVLAFAGRLWWVDLSCGALSLDPFTDQPDLRFVQLPDGREVVMPMGARQEGLYLSRRMGVSEGRLRYVEVTKEEPFVLSSFALDDDDGSCWTLEHQMVLSSTGLYVHGIHAPQQERLKIVVVDPLNASVVHLGIGNLAFAVDMSKEEVLGWSTIDEVDGETGPHAYFKPCVLSPWLESSCIPSAGNLPSSKSNVKGKTLSDILVRVDRDVKN